MEHQPFETWLLEDTPLPPKDLRKLRQHTSECASCAALKSANAILRQPVSAAPAPGFTGRFAERLAAQRQREKRYFRLGMLTLALGAGGILFYTLWLLRDFFALSPVQLLSTWVTFLAHLASLWQAWQVLQTVFARILLKNFTPAAWSSLLLGLAAIPVFWLRLFRRAPGTSLLK